MHAVVHHDHVARDGDFQVLTPDADKFVRAADAGPAGGPGGGIHQIGIGAGRFGVLMIRRRGKRIDRIGLGKHRRQVGGAEGFGIRIIGVVRHDLFGGHGSAVDAHVFHITGKVRVAVDILAAPFVPCVPAGTADIVILIGMHLAQELGQIGRAVGFAGGGILHAVDPVRDRGACDPDDDVIGLSCLKRRRAVGSRFDMLGAVPVNIAGDRHAAARKPGGRGGNVEVVFDRVAVDRVR